MMEHSDHRVGGFASWTVLRRIPVAILASAMAPPAPAERVPLVNPSGEIHAGIDGAPIAGTAVPGWESDGGTVRRGGTDFGNGGWRLTFEDSQSVWQTSGHAIEAGAAYSLRFDAAVFEGTAPGGAFKPDLQLVGPGLRNGDFNADESEIDSRSFAETPEWFNVGSGGDGIQATRITPANVALDGTRNAVLSQNGSRRFAVDTGHTLAAGEIFRATFLWRDASNWNDGSDRVGVTLFTTDDDTAAGNVVPLETRLSGLSTIDSTYEQQSSVFSPVPAGLAGRRLFVFFEGVDGNGDGAGFARLDDFILERGTVEGGPVEPRVVTAELLVEPDGVREVVAARTFEFKSPTIGAWHHYHLAVPAGALDAHAGRLLGVGFRSDGAGEGNFQSVDNVRLDAWPAGAPDGSFADGWDDTPDQVWIGPGFWANRLHDWQVRDGRVDCVLGARDRRTLHRVDRTIRGIGGGFAFAVRTGPLAGAIDGGARSGFLVGAGPNLDWRGALLVHDGLGRDFGLFLGVRGDGAAVIEDYGGGGAVSLSFGEVPPGGLPDDVRLAMRAEYEDATGEYRLTVEARTAGDALLSTASAPVPSDRVLGSFGLLSHRGGGGARFWFDDYAGTGADLHPEPDRHLAILGAMHTVSRGVLKLTAQLPPLDLDTTPSVALETRADGGGDWRPRATAPIDATDGLSSYTATFRIEDWDVSRDIEYRLGVAIGGAMHHWTGTIRRDPVDRDEIVVAATTCQRIADGRVEDDGFDWSPSRLWQPHSLAFTHLARHEPDLFLALGDQIYEGQPTPEDSGTDFNRHHDYLYKWFLWVLQARDLTRHVPTVAIPDDHDVFQGNLWGEGGIPTTSQNTGGYEEPAAWVRMLERTQTSHLPDPDPYHPVQPPPPVEQGIGVYFTGLIHGGVGFAILEDRKFKTGPESRPVDPEAQFLLGERQKAFLREWATDWDGQVLKCVLSQSPFGNLHTHAAQAYNFNLNDRDSHGWPVHRRNEAWELLRLSRMFQIAGDQHLATVAHHGIEAPADAGISFTVPAIANFFPRCWDPMHNAGGTTAVVSPYKGDYFFDGNGTLPDGVTPNLRAADPAHVRILAAANPHEYYRLTRGIDPPSLHDRGAGYGIVRIHKPTRRVTFECWPLHADPAARETGSQFPDWPITIAQADNDGRPPAGFLPAIDTLWRHEPVISVFDESTGGLVYALRARGNLFRPPVYDSGTTYRVEISDGGGDDGADAVETWTGLVAAPPPASPSVRSFLALQPSIVRGEPATLRWDVEGAASAALAVDHGVGAVDSLTVDGIGFAEVAPAEDTTYTLSVDGQPVASTLVRVFEGRDAWLDLHFTPAERLDPQVSGDEADPDDDGWSNDEEFRFQTDPRDRSSVPVTRFEVIDEGGGRQIELTTSFPLGAASCCPIVDFAEDLVSWSAVPSGMVDRAAPVDPSAEGTTMLRFRIGEPVVEGAARLFYRARWRLP